MAKIVPAMLATGAAIMITQAAQAETLTFETHIDAPVEMVWAAVRDPYAVHEKLAPGFVSNVEKEGETRIVTFANGFVVKERIVTIDDQAMRFVYSATEGRATHHMASMQVLKDGDGSTLVWTTDFLPAELKTFIAGNMDQGGKVMRATLEAAAKTAKAE